VAYLFDTDAISETLKRRPAPAFIEWLAGVPREEQYASAVSIAELYRGAYRSEHAQQHLANIEDRVLKAVTVLPFDTGVAHVYGRLYAQLAESNRLLADADLQIAATAIRHGLELVTGNLRHFARVPGLRIDEAFASGTRGPESMSFPHQRRGQQGGPY
jgi:predicted nucleic acid-binding protein